MFGVRGVKGVGGVRGLGRVGGEGWGWVGGVGWVGLDVVWVFRVLWTYGPNKNNFTSLLLTGLLTGVSR